jgi:single-strand DNA-binding protein
MARGLNKVMLIGRIQPNDPELRYTQSGQAVCTFKMVTDESYKDREGNMVERSEWHNIVAWGKAGEIIAQYMKKGSQIYVEGRLQSRKYEDKEGQTRYVTEIVVSDFSFLDSGGSRNEGEGSPRMAASTAARETTGGFSAAPATGASSSVEDDDLPF